MPQMPSIIASDRSLIPACDVDADRFEELIQATHDLPQIGGYKISAELAITLGLPTVVRIARKYTDKPLIYDHQKAGNDIPDTGKNFAARVKASGISALIIFPFTGPETQTIWTQSAQQINLPIILGGHMTHDRFLASEGGYIADSSIERIYQLGALHRLTDFVVPGNKPDVISRLRRLLLEHGVDPIFYAPGFVAQGGTITDAAAAAGPRWHAIIGRAIYGATDMRKAAITLGSHL